MSRRKPTDHGYFDDNKTGVTKEVEPWTWRAMTAFKLVTEIRISGTHYITVLIALKFNTPVTNALPFLLRCYLPSLTIRLSFSDIVLLH